MSYYICFRNPGDQSLGLIDNVLWLDHTRFYPFMDKTGGRFSSEIREWCDENYAKLYPESDWIMYFRDAQIEFNDLKTLIAFQMSWL